MKSAVQRHGRVSAHERRISAALEEPLQGIRDVLSTVGELMHTQLIPADGLDLDNAVHAINAAERVVTKRLSTQSYDPAESPRLLAVLVRISAVRDAISEAHLAGRATAVAEASHALRQTYSATSVRELVQLAPKITGQLGYDRTLFSCIEGDSWVAQSAHAHADTGLAESMIKVSTAAPGTFTRNAPEGHVFRRRVPVLVQDAQSRPEVHRELKALIQPQSYVSAPVVANDRVIGLLHADNSTSANGVNELDRELIGLFAEGLGFVFERTSCYERLTTMRRRVLAETSTAACSVDAFIKSDADAPLSARQDTSGAENSTAEPGFAPALSALTQREREVLAHLAAGERNAQIATRLFVSEGTVKTHVKNILRKLGAENRAQAVARYHAING